MSPGYHIRLVNIITGLPPQTGILLGVGFDRALDELLIVEGVGAVVEGLALKRQGTVGVDLLVVARVGANQRPSQKEGRNQGLDCHLCCRHCRVRWES